MVKKEKSIFAKFKGRELSSLEQHRIHGGTTAPLDKKGTPVTSTTSTKPLKNPLSTNTNGDARPAPDHTGMYV